MIATAGVSLQYGKQRLFENVTITFSAGNCYGLIGANGSGKSTFLKILSGEIDSTAGQITMGSGARLSTLSQDQFAYDEYPVLTTVIMGYEKLYQVIKEKDELYAKSDFSDEDGLKVSELEGEFSEMDGWNAESDAAKLLNDLGIPEEMHEMNMKQLEASQKIRVLLAQALFGNPDILLLDEPTNSSFPFSSNCWAILIRSSRNSGNLSRASSSHWAISSSSPASLTPSVASVIASRKSGTAC